MTVAIIILAAGKGTRMKSAKPKVLHTLAGKSLLSHVVGAGIQLSEQLIVVTGHGAEQVQAEIQSPNIQCVIQPQQLGTAHAVSQAVPFLKGSDKTLILYGDVPLITKPTLDQLVNITNKNTLGLLTIYLDCPTGYGRIIRDDNSDVLAIVEQKDANQSQLNISEVNTGILCIDTKKLEQLLPQISNQNAQGEYYLTDIIALAKQNEMMVQTCHPDSEQEVAGVNDRLQLAELERYYQKQVANKLMASGVSLQDPHRFDCRGDIKTGTDNFIDANCLFEGEVILGSNISIGPNCHIKDSRIADNVTIKANSVIEQSVVGENAVVGPFARLRPGTQLAADTKVGNFVETKNTTVAKGSKINHLSYVGDAELGENVNIGAGTITCNYDGVNKHKTTIANGAFIGSNTSLVAPVSVGVNATVGAGSAIGKSVADGELALTRAKQISISGWKRPEKKS